MSEPDKIEPCPFCGAYCVVQSVTQWKGRLSVICGNRCGYQSKARMSDAEAIATHNEVALAVRAAEKLERTDDGALMVPKQCYWGICRAYEDDPFEVMELVYWQGGGDDCFNPKYTFAHNEDSCKYLWEFFDVEGIYSTREAAEAARKEAT